MSNVAEQVEIQEYALALIDPHSDKVLGMPGARGVQLPFIKIRKWKRTAEEINEAVRIRWGLDTLVLKFLPSHNDGPECAIAEIIGPKDGRVPRDLAPYDVEAIKRPEISLTARNALRRVITGTGSANEPFSRRGWLCEAREWIERSVEDGAAALSGEFRQYNASQSFALVEFRRTDARPIWLKATGEPNTHECDITVRLSQLFPEYLPKLISARADWNAWLTEDAGTALGGREDRPMLLRAVETLAEFQIASLGEIDLLRAVGCVDRSLQNLQAHLGQMFDFLEEAMRFQVSTKSKPLSPVRLKEIAKIVDAACAEMLSLAIPPCLVNGDINFDNILFDGARCRFIDWAEGGIGNPFLTLQQVIQHVIRGGEHQEWVPALCAAYRAKWLPLLSGDEIDRAFSLMSLLTMADYLYGRGEWLNSERRKKPTFQSFARTLARCMDRAAVELSSREVLQS